MVNVIVLVLILVVLLLSLQLFVGGARRRYPYRQRDQLFTPAEWKFLLALQQAVPAGIAIFGKVRVADVLAPDTGLERSAWQSAFNKIAGKHFDFILCDADSGRMRCGIELNDRSHQRRERRERDAFLAGACENAGFPLLMIPAARHYEIVALRKAIHEGIGGGDVSNRALAMPGAPVPPVTSPFPEEGLSCPRCGSPLVERTAKRGKNVGQVFLACAYFPRCRYTPSR